MKMEGNSKATAKRLLDSLLDEDIISKSDDGYYRLIV
jgi:DNA-binding IclR family transcriptional regulator